MKRSKSFTSNNPILYLIATPIGNLKEFSPRAIETIKECDYVAAEDTRNTLNLLRAFNIEKSLISLHEHNEKEASKKIVEKLLQGKKIVYVSDAGYPGISDPSNILVKECLSSNINVSFISGSSAFIGALVASGLSSEKFHFEGFLPAKPTQMKERLKEIKSYKDTLIFYEAPHRIKEMLTNLYEELGNRNIVIARELTKLNEEFIRGNLEEIKDIDTTTIKGEIVLIVEGNKDTSKIDDQKLIEELKNLINKNISKKDAVEIVSRLLGINKNYLYNLVKPL